VPDDAVECRSQFCADNDRLAERLGRVLDTAHHVNRGTDDGEIEPVSSTRYCRNGLRALLPIAQVVQKGKPGPETTRNLANIG